MNEGTKEKSGSFGASTDFTGIGKSDADHYMYDKFQELLVRECWFSTCIPTYGLVCILLTMIVVCNSHLTLLFLEEQIHGLSQSSTSEK